MGRRAIGLVSVLGLILLAAGPLASTTVAQGAASVTMNARILFQGHARSGAWAAIEVDLQNVGPPVQGELRMDGGSQSNTRFATAVSLPTGSHQVYVLHAQPPTFGRNVKVELVANEQVISSVDVAYLVHEATQLVVGVIAERPQNVVAQIDLPPNPFGAAPALVPLGVADLPTRAEGWGVLDRLVWQDIDSNQLSAEQIEALRRWIAAGGRLIILGGTAGIGTLSAFPDDLLPYRPTATVDIDPAVLTGVIGQLPGGAGVLPAMAGELGPGGRPLATSGDRAVAAELIYGSGRVTVLGFDPTTQWIAESNAVDALWSAALPPRTGDGTFLSDDSQLVQAVFSLPNLALPPTSGLLVLIGAYILIIGPINYLVLKRLDRRELAWITMPVLVLAFATAAFGYGALLRGTDVAVNEVAIVRGAPDATEATAQVYFGVFSPTRSTYQVDLPQGALLASPINSDPFGFGAGSLDLVQGTGAERPSAVRNLAVGTNSLRVIRAELPVEGPRMRASLTLENSILTGTFENASGVALENVAVALGTSVVVLGNVPPGATVPVRLTVRDNPFGASLADQIVGASFNDSSEDGIRRTTRYSMINQLTYDPMGMFNSLPGDHAVILAFTRDAVLDLRIGDVAPRRNGNVLHYVPIDINVAGQVTFSSDLIRSSVVDSDAMFFSKERLFISMGAGTATMSYRPIPFAGTFSISEVRFSLGTGGNGVPAAGEEIEPLDVVPEMCTDITNSLPEGCVPRRIDFLPEVEVFDLQAGEWLRLPRLEDSRGYTLKDPARYIDPGTGQFLVRFVNDTPESQVGFGFQVALEGTVR